ncbi:hypothetical protein SAMN06265218_1224 [Fodinibius sediminis]|uniref:Uncharacterized protein n=1 Tax=Fodinibius sediminis TaxID=1214077 RepID=A0A521F2L9_9BACT|nr:hypothetical protein SAMN06265218_1224 [Fodinibius sediminis]
MEPTKSVMDKGFRNGDITVEASYTRRSWKKKLALNKP